MENPNQQTQLEEPKKSIESLEQELEGISARKEQILLDLEKAKVFQKEYPRRYEFIYTRRSLDLEVSSAQKDCPSCRGHGIVDDGWYHPAYIHCPECWTDRVYGHRFFCRCGASHERGPIDGNGVFRCLSCGETRTPKVFPSGR